jgi:predicted DCC family thiol-disulfide oxidoreductase YuxK
MRRNPFIAFLFGLLGAPLSYFSGYSLGAVVFFYSMPATWILLGVSWGLFLCLLTKIARVLEKVTAQTLEDRDSTTDVDLLYDGDCPICKCEICYLQKKDQHRNVNFVNIASEEFASGQSGIDYETAMSQIHAIDGKGNVIIGLPAFAIVYARCGLLLTSTLLRIPLFKIFLNPLYRLFARNRLRMTGRTFFTRKNKRQP